MLAAVAPLTSRVTLGTAALLPVLRRPVQAAQTLASIDLLSGGRLVLTVGAAFPGPVRRAAARAVGRAVGAAVHPAGRDRRAVAAAMGRLPRAAARSRGQLLRFDQLPPMTAPSRAGRPAGVAGRRVGVGAAADRPALRRVDALSALGGAYADGLAAVRAAATAAGPRRGRGDPRAVRVRGGDGHRRAGP